MNKEFAWFLGTLLSDGSITKPTFRGKGDETHIQYCVTLNDRDFLEKIVSIIDSNANIHEYPNYKSPQVKFCDYSRKDIMVKYADIKSVVPTDITRKNYRHFIRGIVDGDGCLNYRKNRDSFRINIINEVFDIVDWCARTICNELKLEIKTPRFKHQDNLYIIEWEGKIARLIAWWLYHGDISDCVLNRKLAYYQQYVLDNNKLYGEEEMLYAIAVTKKGANILPNVNASISLKWCHIIQHLLSDSYTTVPIHHSKGKTKYYFLYIPHMNH